MDNWCSKDLLHLIKMYENHPILWDNSLKSQGNLQSKRTQAWNNIALEMNLEINDVKRKMRKTINYFVKEMLKGKKVVNSENGKTEVYQSKWFALPHMMFLSKNKNNKQNDTELTQSCNEPTSIRVENEPLFEEEMHEPSLDDANNVIENITSKKRKKSLKKAKNNKLMKALNIIQNTTAPNNAQDECGVFGKHVAHKLRHYNLRTRNIVEHQINEILFKADMGDYELGYLNGQEVTTMSIQDHQGNDLHNSETNTKEEIILS